MTTSMESGGSTQATQLPSSKKLSPRVRPEYAAQSLNNGPNMTVDAQQPEGSKGAQSTLLSKLNISDPAMDPSNKCFDFEKWSRTLISLRRELRLPTSPRSGFAFRNLAIHGSGPAIERQSTVWDLLKAPFNFRAWFRRKVPRKILRDLDGVVNKGELLLVLGRRGSGCTTFLKTITGDVSDLELEPSSFISYSGVPHSTMSKTFKGELIYNQELDFHLPYLTVKQTLEFAAAMRTPRARFPGITSKDRVKHLTEVVMTIFGLNHVQNTIVGNDYVRGVSGGERKRVSIAETALSEAAISAWDNSTRGLDAKSALHFVHQLRILSDVTQSSNAAAIYQSSQAMVELFDKILVLYEGTQVYFGPTGLASGYFERMGWQRPIRQPLGDFLLAITNPSQRVAMKGFEDRVPRTPDEFHEYWRDSQEYHSLQLQISKYEREFCQAGAGEAMQRSFSSIRKSIKGKGMLAFAPQTVSFPKQTMLCVKRAWQQLRNDKASVLTTLVGEIAIALVVGSIFFGTPRSTDAFFSYGSVLFFSVLLNVLMAMADIHVMFKGRSVIRKHASYAFYRPSADALAAILIDIPVKFIIGTCFNVIIYFLSQLATTASQFFIFFLFVFVNTMAMSMVFRTIAAAAASLPQAMAVCGFLMLILVMYTGFVLPNPYMPPWFKWISYINPLSYAFEALLVNQAHGENYVCSNLVPPYEGLTDSTFICPVSGAVAGETSVNGDSWFEASYGYSYSNLWRNLGIIFAFFFGFLFAYLLAAELNISSSSKPETLIFLQTQLNNSRGVAKSRLGNRVGTEESLMAQRVPMEVSEANVTDERSLNLDRGTFQWNNLSLTIMANGQSKQLLNDVSGWVRPGTLTALMGVSGAGKTTLLNALAHRTSGVVRGKFYVDGKPLSKSFKSGVGYVQQQDVHLETSTVREALRLSAMLRQPLSTPKSEKLAFVEETIKLLGIEDFADAIVGSPGMGLSIEQRKRLSIGVELVAKPALLLFLDEPTSGLDNQSSEAIVALLRKLAAGGMGILCTIHQPSAMLFQQFDRLLLMARGGKVVYFGDLGSDSETVIQYFGELGPRRCAGNENPAEYLLDVIGNSDADMYDWPDLWNRSREAMDVSTELDRMTCESALNQQNQHATLQDKQRGVYSIPLYMQLQIITHRVYQHYWRSPSYIASKFMLGIVGSIFIGFSFFQPGKSILDVQNGIFSVLMVCAMFSSLVQQTMPTFIGQRELYEARERHSNMYSWVVLILANILAEIPYNILLGVITFSIFNYTIFGIRSSEDQGLVLLFFVYFFILAGTFAHMVVAPMPDASTAGKTTTILFSMMILFAGVFQTPTALPGFWVFMYRASPMTYLIGGISTCGLSGNSILCSQIELAIFQPPPGLTCGAYLHSYLSQGAPGVLLNPSSELDCAYCPLQTTDQVLAQSGMYYNQRWMDWGVGFAYIFFNIISTLVLFFIRLKFKKVDI